MSCEACGAETHRDDAMNVRCNTCEWKVRLCRCERKEPTMTVTQVFTFGYSHRHPTTGESLAKRYVVIEGETREHCRCKMLNHFGREWAFQYDTPEAAGVERHGLTELPWTQFPLSSDEYRMNESGGIDVAPWAK